MPGSAPVEQVGGHQDRGPWPAKIDEIVVGESYERTLSLPSGSVATTTVSVEEITNLGDDGTGHAVRMTVPGGASK